jgi:CHASE3 domain sensor protein
LAIFNIPGQTAAFMKLNASMRKYPLIYPAILVIALVTVNTGILFYNDQVLKDTNLIIKDCDQGLQQSELLWNDVVRNVDVGLRGYALAKNEELLSPMREAEKKKPLYADSLKQVLNKYNFTQTIAFDSMNIAVDNFIATANHMLNLTHEENLDKFLLVLKSDPGKNAWNIFARNRAVVDGFITRLKNDSVKSYEAANKWTLWFQGILFIVSLPTLAFMIFRIVRDSKSRSGLFDKLQKNNKSYLFDPGTEQVSLHEDQIIENSIKNFMTATSFIREVSSGNFSVVWEGMTRDNEGYNKENLSGELMRMRDRMKAIKNQDDIRNWVSEGLAKFSEILRKDQENVESLSYNSLVFITKYMKAQQGALFVLKDDVEGQKYLDMTACYAFDRKKHLSKRVELGQGLVGQAYLEGRTVLMTEIPHGYTLITSGLGESTPNCILIVPFKTNDKIEAVIELAGFKKFENHEVEFMEKIGEIVAATLNSVRNTEMMKTLLEQFKTQTEQLKAQEEELRQNMEEMEATQEAFRRQEREEVKL